MKSQGASPFQLRSPMLNLQLLRKLLLMRALITSLNYWMKRVQQQRPLPPIFGALTSKQLIVPNSSILIPLFPSLREGLNYVLSSSVNQYRRSLNRRQTCQVHVCPSTDISDKRAEAKLCLVIEHTRRTISVYPGAASCSVESLKDGVDYTGSIDRMRFGMVFNTVYLAVASDVSALADAGVDAHNIDEIVYIVYVGGTTYLAGPNEYIRLIAC